jgi:hypothetical protein
MRLAAYARLRLNPSTQFKRRPTAFRRARNASMTTAMRRAIAEAYALDEVKEIRNRTMALVMLDGVSANCGTSS